MAEMRDTVVTWLRDAHAMESAAVTNLEKNVDRFSEYPHIQSRLREDLQQTKTHVQEIEECLDRLGADRSMLKDLGMKFAGAMQPYLTAMAPDEPVKHLLAAHAYEHFEMASYKSLAAAAEQIGEPAIRDMAERSMTQKKQMAEWISEQLPVVTREYLSRAH
jgi:ferritin-like metal-binding protein YciE